MARLTVYEIASSQLLAYLPCVNKIAIEEEKVLSQGKNKVLRKLPFLFNLTFCDFPKSTSCLFKKSQRMHFHREFSTLNHFIVFAHRNGAQMCVSEPGPSPQRGEKFCFQPQSQYQVKVLEIHVKYRINAGIIALIPNRQHLNDSFLDHL